MACHVSFDRRGSASKASCRCDERSLRWAELPATVFGHGASVPVVGCLADLVHRCAHRTVSCSCLGRGRRRSDR